MPELLLELFSEEIPARMQAQACDDLTRLVTDALVARGLTYAGAAAFATPRRLALHVADLPAAQPDAREERKGPKVGAPEAAVAGFLKSVGLATIGEAKVQSDAKKGDFYVAVIERRGRPTLEVLAEVLPEVIGAFPWPKSMHWGDYQPARQTFTLDESVLSGGDALGGNIGKNTLRWVRPLHSILATFGPDTEDPEVVPFTVGGIASGNTTRGHRFMAPEAFTVRRFDDYAPALERAKVVLDPERRRDIIRYDARTLAQAQGFEVVEDEGLLAEVAGLVEWPVVLMGAFDAAFLDIPAEVIRATIRANQKCFVLRDHVGKLANRFVLVANIEASDSGEAIVAGNAKVVRARLADARFFYDTDLAVPLDARLPKLDDIVFHARLGTQGERVKRLRHLAADYAGLVGADAGLAERAATLSKADLVTAMVGEFPELQGLMGRYYAAHAGEAPAVAAAVEEHYKPVGPSDRVPEAPVSVAVALADKMDTLVGFWAIAETPTGSKDPYALRRAALGVIRLILENGLRLPILDLGATALLRAERFREMPEADKLALLRALLAFFADRLKVYLRDKKARHDLIDAVFGSHGSDDFTLVVRRVGVLGAFLGTDEGANLLAGYRRAANILKAEAKKAPAEAASYSLPFDSARVAEPAERALAERLAGAAAEAAQAVRAEDFEGAMRVLATLREPVDRFFDAVTVNAADLALRLNRLRLLDGFRAAVHEVADFSRIGG